MLEPETGIDMVGQTYLLALSAGSGEGTTEPTREGMILSTRVDSQMEIWAGNVRAELRRRLRGRGELYQLRRT